MKEYGQEVVFLINLILSVSLFPSSKLRYTYVPLFELIFFILIVKGFVWKPPDNFEQSINPLWNGWFFFYLMGPIVEHFENRKKKIPYEYQKTGTMYKNLQ